MLAELDRKSAGRGPAVILERGFSVTSSQRRTPAASAPECQKKELLVVEDFCWNQGCFSLLSGDKCNR